MAEHYLNVLTVRLRDYSGHPLPENLVEAITLAVTVGASLDLDQLTDEIRKDLGGQPRRIKQIYNETGWGASGSGAEIIVDVSTVIGGIAGLQVLWAAISQRILRRGQPRLIGAEHQAESARTFLAESLGIGTDSIRIIDIVPVGDGHRIGLETPAGPFAVEVDGHGVSRMHRH
jgi:hypothetical protein